MQTKPYHPFDVHRILVGQPSWPFLIEVGGRAICTYLALLLTMRLLGRRVAGQATLFEISIVVMLAAAIGAPLQAPERGLLAPLCILATAVVLQRTLGAWAARSDRVDRLTAGSPVPLLRDGRLEVRGLRATGLSRDKLFALLRAREIQHLGELHRLHLEANGELSVVPALNPSPGLSVLPDLDEELRAESHAGEHHACNGCGHVERGADSPVHVCAKCGHDTWSRCVSRLER